MKSSPKSALLLFTLVASVFYLRNADLSLNRFGLTRELFTSVTTNFCGDIDPTTLGFTQSDRDAAQSTVNKVNSQMGGNPLKDLVTGGQSWSGDTIVNYAKKLIQAVAAWIIFFIISLIACCCYLCNWCCNYCSCCTNCCDNKCCRCCKPPKDTKRRTLYFVIAVALCLGIFSASIAGIVASKGLKFEKFTCALVGFLDNITYGDKTLKWIGISPAADTLSNLAGTIQNVIDQLKNQQVDTSKKNLINSKLTTCINDIDNLYNNNKLMTVVRADTSASPNPYTPDFISNLGDKSTSGTVCYALYTEMTVKNSTVQSTADEMNSNINSISQVSSSFQSAIDSAKSVAKSMSSSMTSALDSLKSTGTTVNSAGDGLNQGSTAVFAVTLTFGLIAIISLVLVKFCNLKIFNKFTHISWCLLGLFTILGFLLASILYPVSILAVEVCDLFSAILNDQTFLKNTFSTFGLSSDIGDTLNTCIFGSGIILEKFGVADKLGLLNDTLNLLNKVSSYTGTNAPDSIVIPIQQFYVGQFIDGSAPDSQYMVTDLATLNGQTSSASCGMKDKWYGNSKNCTSSDGTVFTAGSAANSGVNSATCLGIWDSWSQRSGYAADASTRYGTCPGAASATLLTGFVNSRKQAADNSHFGKVQADLNTLQSDNGLFMTELKSMLTGFSSIQTTISSIVSDLTDPTTGIISNANCQFIKPNLNRIYDALCVGVITNMYQTSVVLIVLSFFTLFGTCFIFCVAKRALLTDDSAKQ